jgi:deazaflavin-dependent oxidoreductase (nitroreductase family)
MIMTNPPSRPPRRARQARLMRLINVPMRFLLSLPFPTPLSGQLMLLSFTGRKTGKAYRQPVSYVRDADVLLTPGGGNWKLNLRQDQPIKVRFRGRDVRLRPELIEDPGEVERLLRIMMARNPRVASFVPVMGSDGRIDRDKLATAVRYGFRIVRWHFEGPQGS